MIEAVGQFDPAWVTPRQLGETHAGSVFSLWIGFLPYALLERHLVSAITAGAVKG